MKNKRGWLRILEAVIAIMLIMSVFVFLFVRNRDSTNSEEILELEKIILSQIAEDDDLRSRVLAKDLGSLENFVKPKIPEGFSFALKICEPEANCVLDEYREEVWAGETIISSSLVQYSPKKLKIFMWIEK